MCDQVVCERWCVTKKDDMCVCVTKLCMKDGVCESDVCVCECDISVDFFLSASAPMSSAWHAASLRTCHWRNEVCQDLLCSIVDTHDAAWKHQSMWCNEMLYVLHPL